MLRAESHTYIQIYTIYWSIKTMSHGFATQRFISYMSLDAWIYKLVPLLASSPSTLGLSTGIPHAFTCTNHSHSQMPSKVERQTNLTIEG